jgi:hypothetical protein
VVSRAILTEIREGRGIGGKDYVHLDLTHLGEKKITEKLWEITSFARTYVGVDPVHDPIPVAPTCHYIMGGIPSDTNGRVLADEKGYFCGKLLADLGADVIKIERPSGDPARNIGPFYENTPHPEKSLSWLAFNTSKRSITLNIETQDGRELFRRTVDREFATIRRVFDAAGIKTKDVAASLSGNAVIVKKISLPVMTDAELSWEAWNDPALPRFSQDSMESVVAECQYDGGRLVEVRLHPIDLGINARVSEGN